MKKLCVYILLCLSFALVNFSDQKIAEAEGPLINVNTPAQSVEKVYVDFRGLDRKNPAHHKQELSFITCQNYMFGPKEEENPLYGSLSVRPGITAFLNDLNEPFRGLFPFRSSTGTDDLIACTSTSIWRSGASSWEALKVGQGDAPYEGQLWSDSNITRLYLTNGSNTPQKYLAGQSSTFDMQNQDDEIALSSYGSVWFTNGATTATCEVVVAAVLSQGQYIKSSTDVSADEWVEIIDITGTTLTFSYPYIGATGTAESAVASSDMEKARFITEYEGHIIMGYTGVVKSSTITGNSSTNDYYILNSAYGVAFSFEADSVWNKITFSMWRGTGTTGNLLLKIKSSLTGSATTTIKYPVASLAITSQEVAVEFGSKAAGIYYCTIERENSSTSPVYIGRSPGQSFWTYNETGFDSNWNTGTTTVEIITGDSSDAILGPHTYRKSEVSVNYNYDTDITSWSVQIDVNRSSQGTTRFQNTAGEMTKGVFYFPIEQYHIKNEENNYLKIALQLAVLRGTGTFEATARAYEITTPNQVNQMTGNNRLTGTAWGGTVCSLEGVDFTNTNSSAISISALSSYDKLGYSTIYYGTSEVNISNIASDWTISADNNYGIIISSEVYPQTATYLNNANNPWGTLYPRYELTTLTGSTETSTGIYFKVTSEIANRSRVIYSRRNFPELFPALNVLDIAGTVTGLINSGGYLIIGATDVGADSPSKLYYLSFTGETDDGFGLDFINSVINNTTVGSSKSIKNIPNSTTTLFYSGTQLNALTGQGISSISDIIKDEAKKFQNRRSPNDWYNGYADMQPQATIMPEKNLYLLAYPAAESKNSYISVYDYNRGAFTQWTGLYPTAMAVRKSSGGQPVLYMGFQDGQCWTLDKTGSTSSKAILEWVLNDFDITKKKTLKNIEIIGRADNPLQGSIITLEAQSTDSLSSDEIIENKSFSEQITDNSTTNNMVHFVAAPDLTAREIKLKLTQSSTQGAISLRAIREIYTIEKTRP